MSWWRRVIPWLDKSIDAELLTDTILYWLDIIAVLLVWAALIKMQFSNINKVCRWVGHTCVAAFSRQWSWCGWPARINKLSLRIVVLVIIIIIPPYHFKHNIKWKDSSTKQCHTIHWCWFITWECCCYCHCSLTNNSHSSCIANPHLWMAHRRCLVVGLALTELATHFFRTIISS